MLTKEQIEKIRETIINKFNPKKIYLFGSYAYGNPKEDSDLDLLVINDTDKNTNKLAFEISKSLFPRNYGLDIICCNENSFNEKLKNRWVIFSEIASKGKLLYERN